MPLAATPSAELKSVKPIHPAASVAPDAGAQDAQRRAIDADRAAMGALRLYPAQHFQLERNGVSVGRCRRARIPRAKRQIACRPLGPVPDLPKGLGEIGDVAGAVTGSVGIGDVLRDHGLSGRGMAGLRAGKREYLEPVEHRGFSHFGYTDA